MKAKPPPQRMPGAANAGRSEYQAPRSHADLNVIALQYLLSEAPD